VGLDWADQKHVLCLQAVDSEQVESIVLEQKPEVLGEWISQLRRRFPQGRVAIALEQSRGGLLYALLEYEFLVLYPVPPKSLARYREAFYPSGGKNDPVDAELLLEMLRTHGDRLSAWVPDDVATRQLRLLAERRRQLVNQRTRLTNRLTALLKEYFPQALEWAGPLGSPEACEFLTRWPTLQALQQAPSSEVRHFYLAQGARQVEGWAQRGEEIRRAQPLTSDPAITEASALLAESLAEQIRSLLPGLKRFDQALQEKSKQHPDYEIFASFPGAGEVLAPRLLVAWGSDRQRYQKAAEMQSFSGIAPVTEQSGKSCWVHWRMACPKFLRQSFHEFAGQSRLRSVWARAYYEQRRLRGCGHHAALRALAFKWIRIMYRCWKDRTPYDERLYLEALRRHTSPLLSARPSSHTT